MPHRIDEELKAKGFDPNQIREQIKGHIQNSFGGSIQNYADAIKSKPVDQLSDPRAAEALRMLSPNLFGEQSGQLGANARDPGKMMFSFGQTAPMAQDSGMHPNAIAMINAIGQHQQANPFTLPVAPGTKMRWQINDEEAQRAQAAIEALQKQQFDYGRERDALADSRWEQEFSANEAYRAAQLAKGSGGADPTTDPFSEAMYSVDWAIESNPQMSLHELHQQIAGNRQLIEDGVNIEKLLDYLNQKYYSFHYNKALEAVRGGPKWDYGQDLSKLGYDPLTYTKALEKNKPQPTKEDPFAANRPQ